MDYENIYNCCDAALDGSDPEGYTYAIISASSYCWEVFGLYKSDKFSSMDDFVFNMSDCDDFSGYYIIAVKLRKDGHCNRHVTPVRIH